MRDARGDGAKWMTGPYVQTKEMRGAARVQPGSLAVSRSLGDCTLKSMHDPPIIITDPETFQVRECESALCGLRLSAPPTQWWPCGSKTYGRTKTKRSVGKEPKPQ